MSNNTIHTAIAAVLLLVSAAAPMPAAERYDRFIGAAAETFPDPSAAVDAFRSKLVAGDVEGVARILGLNAGETAKTEDFKTRFDGLSAAAKERVAVEEDGADKRTIILGRLVWPFPFPLVKKDNSWTFDTKAGLEEVVARRVGENETRAIETCRAYVEAQKAYATADWDDDGVMEYAQLVLSSRGQQDGLYWSSEEFDEESPAGQYVVEVKLRTRTDPKQGYFGYRFRILRGQGSNVAGGRYDYVINGNMIAGFALIAWPVEYGLTGVKTFMISHHGAVYENDLGPNTAAAVDQIVRFNPDDSWTLVAN
jgi:hypothetical protein